MARNADVDAERDRNGRTCEKPGTNGTDGPRDRPTLAEFVRDAVERGDGTEALAERVRASYDREISRRRVRRLVDAERERLEPGDADRAVEVHAPRYVDPDDLSYLTDAEFGRVVAALLGERGGRAAVVTGGKRAASGTDEAETVGKDGNDGDDAEDDRNHESVGVWIRWHRGDEPLLVRAIAAEPSRVVTGETVRRVREPARPGRETRRHTERENANGATGERGDAADGDDGDEDGDREPADSNGYRKRDPVERAIVTVADVVPGAARLAVRTGVEIHDRAALRRWLDEAKLSTETFGSLIEDA